MGIQIGTYGSGLLWKLGVIELPFSKDSHTVLLSNVLGNWQLNGIATIQTGYPFTATNSR